MSLCMTYAGLTRYKCHVPREVVVQSLAIQKEGETSSIQTVNNDVEGKHNVC